MDFGLPLGLGAVKSTRIALFSLCLMSVLILSSLHWHHVARTGEKTGVSAQNAGVGDQGTAGRSQFGEFIGKKNVRHWAVGGLQTDPLLVRSRAVCCG